MLSGQRLILKGNNKAYYEAYQNTLVGRATFSGSTAEFDADGNIMSLIGGDNFSALTEFSSNFCFLALFEYTNIVSAQNLSLPVTALTSGCYQSMFQGCTSLTAAPELPATTLAAQCYGRMFKGCTSLTAAPELPATTLVTGCYGWMFSSCSNLNYIKAMSINGSGPTYMQSWVDGVASSGTFVKNSAATWTTTGVNGIPTNWTVETASE